MKKKGIAAVLSGLLVLGIAAATAAAGEDAVYTTKGGTWEKVDDKTWMQDPDHDGQAGVLPAKIINRGLNQMLQQGSGFYLVRGIEPLLRQIFVHCFIITGIQMFRQIRSGLFICGFHLLLELAFLLPLDHPVRPCIEKVSQHMFKKV